MSVPTKADLDAALAAPSLNEGCLVLRQRCRMPLNEAKEAINAAREAVSKGDGMRADDMQAVAEAMNAVDTFDELTALMLRHMRDTKQPIATGGCSSGPLLQQCSAIYDAFATMIQNNVNPGRAMTAFILKCHHQQTVSAEREADQAVMQEVIAQTLRDDILTLL